MIETIIPLSFVPFFTTLFAILAVLRLEWAILTTVALLPAYLLRFHFGPLPSTFLEAMLLIVIAVWVVKTAIQHFRKPGNQEVRYPWMFLLLAILLVGIIAVFISPDLRAGLGLYRAYLLEPILFFWVFVNVMKTPKQLWRTVWALGITALLVAIVADMQSTGLVPIPEPYASEVPQRTTSVYPFPTAIGKYLAPILAMFLAFLFVSDRSKESWKRMMIRLPIILFILGEGIWALLTSVNRGALLGVFAALIFISFFSRLKRWIWLGLVLGVLFVAVFPGTRSEIVSIVTRQDTSTDVHLVLWQGAWKVVKANPVVGTGLASFPIVYEKYKLPQHVEFFPNPDQFVLTLWIELGLAGLLLFAILFVRIFRLGCSLLRSSQFANSLTANRPLIVSILAAMVAILVHGLVDTPYFKNDLAVEFWVIVGLLVALATTQSNSPRQKTETRPSSVGAGSTHSEDS